jgi:hypothetical protein
MVREDVFENAIKSNSISQNPMHHKHRKEAG